MLAHRLPYTLILCISGFNIAHTIDYCDYFIHKIKRTILNKIDRKRQWLVMWLLHSHNQDEDYTQIHFKSHLVFRTISNYSISYLFHLMRIMICKYDLNWRFFHSHFLFSFVLLYELLFVWMLIEKGFTTNLLSGRCNWWWSGVGGGRLEPR